MLQQQLPTLLYFDDNGTIDCTWPLPKKVNSVMYGKLDFSRKIWLTFFLFYFSLNSRFSPHQILSNGSIFLNPEHFVKYSFSLGMRLQCCNCSRSFTTFNYLQPFEEVKSRAVNYNQGSETVYEMYISSAIKEIKSCW